MKNRFNLTSLLVILLISSLLLTISCSKENSQSGTDAEEEEIAQVSAESGAEAETVFNEFFDDAMGADNNVGVSGSGVFFNRGDSLTPVPRCFTITVTHPNGTPFPAIVELNFGTVGCPGPDGRVRRGKMITEYSNRLILPGAVATTTFDGFYVDAVHVEGTHVITNISGAPIPPATIARKFKVEVINGKLSQPNGNFIEWNSTKTITQVDGLLTPDFPRDDAFKIEGAGHGVVKRGNLLARWESSITEPLLRRFTCRWIVKGRIRTVRVNLPANSRWVPILDFGAGNCDNQATITINGITRQITLP
ncbi:MAG TPA: hypothetical protein VMZ03_05580 [Chitinophagaceae bacterium]|nr:hypothetical protein [Chitinophagaceae bacterium]